MRLKHIITTFAVIALTAANCMADEISPMLTARRRPSLTEQKQPVVTEPSTCLDNSEMNLVIPEETAPVFKPYQLSKGEVLFSYTKAWINAIDPTAYTNRSGSYLPGARGINQLVIYTPNYGPRTNTNEFGAEAVVEDNTVTELSGADSLIPPNGIVISGHGKAKTWMNTSIKVGTKIYIDRSSNLVYTYTTSESYIFESEKKFPKPNKC